MSDTGKPLRWHQPLVRLHVDDSMAELSSDPVAVAARAFGSWQQAKANDLPQFEFAAIQGSSLSLEPDGINAILVGRVDIEGHERDLALTVTFSDEISGAILETDIIVNSRYDFANVAQPPPAVTAPVPARADASEGCDEALEQDRRQVSDGWNGATCRDTYDLEALLAHEAGHVLGLGEDRVDASATMYYRSEPCDIAKQSLAESDEAAIRELYLVDPAPEPRPKVSCSAGPRRAGDGRPPEGVLWILFLAGLLGRRLSALAPSTK